MGCLGILGKMGRIRPEIPVHLEDGLSGQTE